MLDKNSFSVWVNNWYNVYDFTKKQENNFEYGLNKSSIDKGLEEAHLQK